MLKRIQIRILTHLKRKQKCCEENKQGAREVKTLQCSIPEVAHAFNQFRCNQKAKTNF
jgi:hypothetical protein